MKLNKEGKQAYKLVEKLLYARRNNNIKTEEKAYNDLQNWCNKHSADMEQVITDIQDYMRKNSIAAGMNGLI